MLLPSHQTREPPSTVHPGDPSSHSPTETAARQSRILVDYFCVVNSICAQLGEIHYLPLSGKD
ncbi:hypothetical protein BJX61DRAFT_495168, partial [Aspergillus egyptiacus]